VEEHFKVINPGVFILVQAINITKNITAVSTLKFAGQW
jgi:hypothetical protein